MPPRASIERDPTRSHRLTIMLLCLAAILACRADDPERPDLFLITIDGLSADRLGCFGGDVNAGASACALAENGTLFAWAATPGRGEASSAATLLTGLAAARHGVGDDGQSFLADEHETIAEVLSAAGYATAAFVASAPLNRSRRLDQGFDRYDDGLAMPREPRSDESIELAGHVQSWLDSTPSPRFAWIHADRANGRVAFDRLLSRLSQVLDPAQDAPGVFLVALRGESRDETERATRPEATISWSTHRVPLVWRPPSRQEAGLPRISRRLVSLVDAFATLRAAARLAGESSSEPAARRVPASFRGRNLTKLARRGFDPDDPEERFVLIGTNAPGGEIGLASQNHLYVRPPSPLDGSGRPVPTPELRDRGARFADLPRVDPLRDPAPRSAALEPGPWREDVLDVESPVPRLEFHLARRLGELANPLIEDPR